MWLERKEKIEIFEGWIVWRLGRLSNHPLQQRKIHHPSRLTLTKRPSNSSVLLTDVVKTATHGALIIQESLLDFINELLKSRDETSGVPPHQLRSLPFDTIPVWHRVKVINANVQGMENVADRADAIHATPQHFNPRSTSPIPSRFDTVLVDEMGTAEETGIEGTFILFNYARIHV